MKIADLVHSADLLGEAPPPPKAPARPDAQLRYLRERVVQLARELLPDDEAREGDVDANLVAAIVVAGRDEVLRSIARLERQQGSERH